MLACLRTVQRVIAHRHKHSKGCLAITRLSVTGERITINSTRTAGSTTCYVYDNDLKSKDRSRDCVSYAGRSNDPSGTDGPFVIVLVSRLERSGRPRSENEKEKTEKKRKKKNVETRLGDLLIGL